MAGMLFDALHAGMTRVLDLREQQHALTASNLANADTPGYLARYIPFDRALKAAVGQDGELALRQTDPHHEAAASVDLADPLVEEMEAPPWALDGNSVSAEREMVRMTENSLMYNAVAEGLGRRLGLLKYAASNGKV